MSDIRTPPSLKWLLDKRARLLGEVKRFQKAGARKRKLLVDEIVAAKRHLAELEERQAQRSPEEILAETYQRDLAVVDRALQLHHIQIDVNLIPPIRSQTGEKYLAHGELTRLIYQKLKSIYPSAATATEITLFILATSGDEMDSARFDDFRLRVRHRMKSLAKAGVCRILCKRVIGRKLPQSDLETRCLRRSTMYPRNYSIACWRTTRSPKTCWARTGYSSS